MLRSAPALDGVEMVRGSFGAAVLTEIVEQHVVHYDMNNCERGAGPSNEPSPSMNE